ncbi:PPE family protein [Mycobacterium decipiens]|uniref:PPE family protein n=1 Tax=Mycobacterium decipiens TaxID=1430326 RepID=A0A1X2LY94_9MYCO|nr:PPE family protein [Mycobacterium decipiens]OSC42132.1 hypothetical protein B8W66_06350 [Mycobacterium decipiens]
MGDFELLPPEINSTNMYSGSGAESLLIAAGMWDQLAADLYSAAETIQSVVWGVTTGSWMGASSGLMAVAVAPYVAWMNIAAAQAELTADQLRAAAAAYEAAYEMTVPPELVAQNRIRLAMLTATNIFGQNTTAMAAAETEYCEMWAQDTAAMYGYAAAAAIATDTLTPFEEAPEITNVGGLALQAAAVNEAFDSATANQLMNNVPEALYQLALPAQSSGPLGKLGDVWKAITPHLGPVSNIVSILNNHVGMAGCGVSMLSTLSSLFKGMVPAAAEALEAVAETAAETGVSALSSLGSGLGLQGVGSGVAAGLGKAVTVGSFSAPPAWNAATEAVTPAARALPLANLVSDTQPAPGHMLGGLPVGQMASGAGGGVSNTLRVPARAYVIPRIPAAG